MLWLLLCNILSKTHFLINSAVTQQRLSTAEQNKTISEQVCINLRKQILDISNRLGGVAWQQIYEGKDPAFYYWKPIYRSVRFFLLKSLLVWICVLLCMVHTNSCTILYLFDVCIYVYSNIVQCPSGQEVNS